ncbi:hypothetical protein ABIF83_004671 [Bradyrhizobium ottawaense]
MEMKLAALPRVAQSLDLVKLLVFAAICVAMAELAGPVTIPLGGAYRITLLPFLWAMLIGVVWGIASPRLPGALRLDMNLQRLASLGLQLALLLFIAKLGLLVGGSLPRILDAGWALMFQEFGHFFGTAMVGLPIALLLGIKREAIGATFSVGREPSLAIIGERYGMDSPEGRGVLAEYITGTVFGTIFISLFASLVTSLGIFHPRALAMGAGMGSGSLMAAAASAISAQQSPEIAKEVAAFAAASNLITTTIGTYFTLFLSLPFTVWAYAVLEPIFRRRRLQASSGNLFGWALGRCRSFAGRTKAFECSNSAGLGRSWLDRPCSELPRFQDIARLFHRGRSCGYSQLCRSRIRNVQGRGGSVPCRTLGVSPSNGIDVSDDALRRRRRRCHQSHQFSGTGDTRYRARRPVDFKGSSSIPQARLAYRGRLAGGERWHVCWRRLRRADLHGRPPLERLPHANIVPRCKRREGATTNEVLSCSTTIHAVLDEWDQLVGTVPERASRLAWLVSWTLVAVC